MSANFEPHLKVLTEINLPAFLYALGACESNNNDAAIGRHGERGRFQIRASTWKAATHFPFLCAHASMTSEYVATTILKMYARILMDHGAAVNPTNLAQLWNCGTLIGGPNDFARRVNNLYLDASP